MEQWIKISQEHPAVQYLVKKDKRLARVIYIVGDIEYVVQADCFSRLIRSIVNQMLSNKIEADKTVTGVLLNHKEKIPVLVDILLEKGSISGDEFGKILRNE